MKGPVKEISFHVFHRDRFFFIMEERGISSGGMFALCLEGEWLDPDRFIAAVARMMDRNPKCASRIVRVPSFLGERFYWEPCFSSFASFSGASHST